MTPAHARPVVGPRPGRLERLRVTEPLLVMVGVGDLVLIVAAVLVAAVTGYWSGPVIVAGTLLLQAPALWAARASVYSAAGLLRRAQEQQR